MENRSYRVRTLSILSSVLLLAVLVLVNVVFARTNLRMDLTEDNRHTLSPATSKVLGGLQDPVSIKMFWHNVPAMGDPAKEEIASLLSEMDNESDNLSVLWVDMEEDSAEEAARKLGVPQGQFQAASGSELVATKGYMSLVIESGDKDPTVFPDVAQFVPQLEYMIMADILKRSRTETPVVGLVLPRKQSAARASARDLGYSELATQLQRILGNELRDDIQLRRPVEEAVSVLMVASPQEMSEEQVYHFEQFLLRGGRGMLLLDPVHLGNTLDPRNKGIRESGFEQWLADLGVTVERGVVADTQSFGRLPNMQGRQLREIIKYPFWVRVKTENQDKSNVVTSSGIEFSLYWPAAVSVDEAVQKAQGREATVWATTTPGGVKRKDIQGVGTARASLEGLARETVPLAVYLDGPAVSFWKGKFKEKPENSDEGDDAIDDMPQLPEEGDEQDGADSGSPDGDDSSDVDIDEGDTDEGDAKDSDPNDGASEDADPLKDETPEQRFAGPKQIDQGSIKLLVVGDGEFVNDVFASPQSIVVQLNGRAGLEVAIGTMLWMAGGDDLMELRTRNVTERKLEPTEASTQKTIKYAHLLSIPLLLALCGMVVFFLRRN